MPEVSLSIDGVRVPPFLYGTAWKEEATQGLTELAITQGFRGIDTANQRRHYHEVGVGQGDRGGNRARRGYARGLFLQTKFTSAKGRIIGSLTIPMRRSPIRWRSRLPARSNIWARTTLIRTCCTARRGVWDSRRGLGSVAGDGSDSHERPCPVAGRE